MALCAGVCSRSSFDFADVPFLRSGNLSKRRVFLPVVLRDNKSLHKQRLKIGCFASRGNVTPELESEENASVSSSKDDDGDFSHVIKFKMSDFKIHDRVSIGLGNRVCENLTPNVYLSHTIDVVSVRFSLQNMVNSTFVLQGDEVVYEATVKEPSRCVFIGGVCSS